MEKNDPKIQKARTFQLKRKQSKPRNHSNCLNRLTNQLSDSKDETFGGVGTGAEEGDEQAEEREESLCAEDARIALAASEDAADDEAEDGNDGDEEDE